MVNMQQLLEYQKSFYEAIFNNSPIRLQNVIGPIEDFQERFIIYRDNVFASLKDVLREDFPNCRRILGEKVFNQAIFEFVRMFPPDYGCLFKYGDQFPIFINAYLPNEPYVMDIARLEWAKKSLYYCRDAKPMENSDFLSIPCENYSYLTFKFTPAISFIESKHAIREIWEATQIGIISLFPPIASLLARARP
jgi:hypothetical protein